MPHSIPASTSLRSGQSLHLHVSRGVVIVAMRGDLTIAAAPSWLGEQLLQQRFFLNEGCAHLMADSGWIAIAAHADAEVAFASEHYRRHSLAQVLRAVLAATRQLVVKRFLERT
ncbi:hypothetical protein D3870_01190 [Noviherbaspirillum cavernae]|uniref:DUF2917 domain-containing protein n=1 Tax=Noviherbaspirillum cavernae TaxID=2320862 RepID=A0A418WX52_9BURK|nr:hypothetical protein [Noviherbaspirillum cavernae]RJG04819.1 hypothetical protein D3870_01190 [Noviherbaspirillum cavernae]